MSSLVLENELDEIAGLRSRGFLRKALVATEDRALLFTVSSKQLNHVANVCASAGAQ